MLRRWRPHCVGALAGKYKVPCCSRAAIAHHEPSKTACPRLQSVSNASSFTKRSRSRREMTGSRKHLATSPLLYSTARQPFGASFD